MLSRTGREYYDMLDICRASDRKRNWIQIFSEYAVAIINFMNDNHTQSDGVRREHFNKIRDLDKESESKLPTKKGLVVYSNGYTKHRQNHIRLLVLKAMRNIFYDMLHMPRSPTHFMETKANNADIAKLFDMDERKVQEFNNAVSVFERHMEQMISTNLRIGKQSNDYYRAATYAMQSARTVGSILDGMKRNRIKK